MGDRCYMQVNCRPEHVQTLSEGGDRFRDDGETATGAHRLEDCEANYAYGVNYEEFGELPKGIPFYGWHDSGDDYGPGVFATDGESMHYMNGRDDTYEIRFDMNTGEPNQVDLKQCKEFLLFYSRVCKLVDCGKEVPSGR